MKSKQTKPNLEMFAHAANGLQLNLYCSVEILIASEPPTFNIIDYKCEKLIAKLATH